MSRILHFLRNLWQGFKPVEVSPKTQSFINHAHEEMLNQHQEHATNWKYGKEKGWTADLEAGIIVFQFAGDTTGTSHFQTVGIYDETSQSFTWAWSQRSLPSSLRNHATMAKHWGQAQGHRAFSTSNVICNMEDAWKFAAVTQKLAGAHSVYRGRVGNRYIFMTTDEIHINHATTPMNITSSDKSPAWSKGRHRPSW